MLKKIGQAFAFFVCLAVAGSQAHAVNIGGTDYDLLLSLDLKDHEKLAMWRSMAKGYTGGNTPIDVQNVLFADDSLAGAKFEDFYLMFTTVNKQFDDGLASATATVYGDFNGQNNQALITLTYAGAGIVDSTLANGAAGQLNVTGLFNVTGGLLGLTGQLYLEAFFDNVIAFNHIDIHANNGRVNFYSPNPGGGAEVPEPATMALLASSLFGAARLRKKNAE